MSDFSKQPQELTLIPVELPVGDVCDGCYYHCQQTEICQHPTVGLDDCIKLAERRVGAPEHYENFIFVEVV